MAFAFDPDYACRKDTRQFVSGGRAGKLILNSKGFLGFGSRGLLIFLIIENIILVLIIFFFFFFFLETVLHSGEGPIFAISWKGTLIAWANNRGFSEESY